MPVFDYLCLSCGGKEEFICASAKRDARRTCGRCAGQLKRQMSLFNFNGATYVGTDKFDHTISLGKKFESSKEVDAELERTGAHAVDPYFKSKDKRSKKEITEKELSEFL